MPVDQLTDTFAALADPTRRAILTRLADGEATVNEIAGFYRISSHHVAKVVNQLARLGYVRSIRGVGGGLELGRSAETVRIGDVIHLVKASERVSDV